MKISLNPKPITSFFFFVIAIHLSPCLSSIDSFKDCSESYSCGELVNIAYPFWGNKRKQICGRKEFRLNCNNNNRTTTIRINSIEYYVLQINQTNSIMRIARSDLFDNYCPQYEIKLATMDRHPFEYSPNNQNISVAYNCSAENKVQIPGTYEFRCGSEAERQGRVNYAFEPSVAATWITQLEDCEMNIEVAVTIEGLREGLKNRAGLVENGAKRGFEVEYNNFYEIACEECNGSGGNCGGNETYPFFCICRNGAANPYYCQSSNSEKLKDKWMKVIIGVGSCIGGVVIMGLICFIGLRLRKRKHARAFSVLRHNNSCDPPMKELEKGENYMAVHLFSYHELGRATDKFNPANKLGDGGFGTVYYGKLQDGREVAVKRLFENNYRKVQHFMNEVQILTRLHHPHLVTLYGCTSHRSRELLLVYEFISNGTVADHLHGNRAKPGELSWHTRLKIAIETANALAFLHASETIHRDVKTTNILLDNNFSVKVADFGLSRLFPIQATHISTAPQGTPGYVDPEYYECYQLTNKSDVYSFGVVLVELISSKPAVDITRHRHEINLSTMAINKIQNNELHDFVDPSLGFETDERVRDMICAVAEMAFQCLQSVKDTRPSMLEALEILKNIESRSCGKEKSEEIDISVEDNGLLKSPDSVVAPWISKTSTPNGSG